MEVTDAVSNYHTSNMVICYRQLVVQRLGFLYVAAIRDICDTLNSVMFALLRHLYIESAISKTTKQIIYTALAGDKSTHIYLPAPQCSLAILV